MTVEVKKGNASWKPHQALELTKRDPNFRYRWVNKDEVNMDRKLNEGWVFASKNEATHLRLKTVEAGSGEVGAQIGYRDVVLMKIPEEQAKAREAYYAERTAEQTKGLKGAINSKLRAGSDKSAGATGEITIS